MLCRSSIPVIVCALLVATALTSSVWAEGFLQSPFGPPSGIRSGLDLSPSNPLGMPGSTAGLPSGADSLYLNSAIFREFLPLVPNLEIGYLYQFGNVINTGRLSFDYVLPARPTNDSAIFGEAHAEFTNFGKTLQRIFSYGNTATLPRAYRDRIDLSGGGGYRKMLAESVLVGANGFADATKVGDQWYGSGGIGFEMAALGAGNDLVELNFNYYGNIFQGRDSRSAPVGS